MCCACKKGKDKTVHKKFSPDGETSDSENSTVNGIPEHVDNLMLNRNVHNGVLGFRYENKDSIIVVYSSVEAKTFCMIMQLTPLKK